MPYATRAGDVLADRYRLVDLLSESRGGRFWRAHDRILERHVALHVIAAEDPRAGSLRAAARRSATVLDQRILRVLDAEEVDGCCFVVNEWGSGTSLDIMLASNGPLSPRRAAWLVSEVADSVAVAHAHGVAHGKLSPENVLVDDSGAVKLIGFCVDAALNGLPAGEPQRDVVDLAGLLHATLTGRWAGLSPSAVPRAPEAHGRVLRPRQVRAGVPRPLDDLCEDILNPRGSRAGDVRDLGSARAIASVLVDFVGDPSGLPEAIAAGNPEKHETVSLPAVPEIMAKQHPDDWRAQAREAAQEAQEAESAAAADRALAAARPDADGPGQAGDSSTQGGLATQAGLPIFDDDNDEVTWLRAREERPAPPPPFEPPPERPLFASEPRRPRHPRLDDGPVVPRGDEYWPFDHERPADSTQSASAEGHVEDTGVPGRSFLRLAAVVAVVLLLVVAIAITFNLSRGRTPLGAEPTAEPITASPTAPRNAAPAAYPIASVVDFDPQGSDGTENADSVSLATDGDSATSWTTVPYFDQLGRPPAGIKEGVGLLVDLGRPRQVRALDVTTAGGKTGVSIYVASEAPADVDDLTPAATADVDGTAKLTLDRARTGRYVVVWLTSLPPVGDDFRGRIAEIVVAG